MRRYVPELRLKDEQAAPPPTDRVVLLSGDVNRLAKADVAGLPTADTPDPDPAEK